MIDLHSHLLPGVDDGASDLAEALDMCRMAAEEGCTAIVATPHLRHESWENDDRRRLEDLWLELRNAALPLLEVFLGGEIAVNSQSCSELEELPGGDLLSLAGSRYLLLEFHPRGLGPDPEELIHELVVEGWVPIIAHPERFRWLAEDLGFLESLVDIGARVQLTAMSVDGGFGRRIQNLTFRMLDASLVHFVSSDAHGVRFRPPGLAKAYEQVVERCGEATAQRLFVSHPRAVLENRLLKDQTDSGLAPQSDESDAVAQSDAEAQAAAVEPRPAGAMEERPKKTGVVSWLSRGRR
ncbi:MAG: CpsB/CapC family capsule biosynthesis tyrosine phosphatase [Acidobacteriota bacterium]